MSIRFEVSIKSQQAIGIFDSGVGGLSVLSAVRQLLPNENLVYVADTLYTPYGGRSAEFIESRVLSIAEFLAAQSVKLITVACNTATAAAVNSLREKHTIPIVGLEPALKPAVSFSAKEKVGVLATKATLDSEKYRQLRSRFTDDVEIVERASPLFVELVEKAPEIGPNEYQLIANELAPFVQAEVDALVLGCTHYPFLTETITNILGPSVSLFESAYPVAREIKRRNSIVSERTNNAGQN